MTKSPIEIPPRVYRLYQQRWDRYQRTRECPHYSECGESDRGELWCKLDDAPPETLRHVVEHQRAYVAATLKERGDRLSKRQADDLSRRMWLADAAFSILKHVRGDGPGQGDEEGVRDEGGEP